MDVIAHEDAVPCIANMHRAPSAEPVEILAAQVGQTSGDAGRPGPSAMLYYGRS
jgi:hypothetical protein